MIKQPTKLSPTVIEWKLKEVMQQRGIDYRELAAMTGLHYTTTSTHKNLRQMPSRLPSSTLIAYCEALDCQPGDIMVRLKGSN